MAKKFISDSEMEALEKQHAPKAFISDADMAKLESNQPKKGGSLSNFLFGRSGTQETPRLPTLEETTTAFENAGNAITFGHLPQLQAGLIKAKDMIVPESMESGKDYVQLRDENIRRQQKMTDENPKSALAGTATGLISSMAVPVGGLGKIKALQSVKGAPFLANLGKGLIRGGGSGAIVGSLQNPGDVEGEVNFTQIPERIEGAGQGAKMGALTVGGIESLAGLGRGIVKAGKKAKEMANDRAYKSLGPDLRTITRHGKDKAQQIGAEVLDSKLLKVIPNSYEEISTLANKKLNEKGKIIGEIIDDIETATNGKVNISKKALAKKLTDEMADLTNAPGSKQQNKKLDKFVKELISEGEDSIGIKESQKFKGAVAERAGFKKLPGTATFKDKLNKKLYTLVKEAQEEAGDEASKLLGDDVSSKFKGAKKAYRNLSEASDMADKKFNRERANNTFGLTDTIMGTGGGLLSGGYSLYQGDDVGTAAMKMIGGALAVGGGSKLTKLGGNQPLAIALDKLSKGMDSKAFQSEIGKLVKTYGDKNPEKLVNAVIRLSKQNENKGLLSSGLIEGK